MTKRSQIITRGFVWLLLGLELLNAFPVGLIALYSLEKFFAPVELGHFMLEASLLLATVTTLWLPLAYFGRKPRLLFWSVVAFAISQAIAIGLLFSPLYKGFIH